MNFLEKNHEHLNLNKNEVSKTKQKALKIKILLLAFFTIFACSKDDSDTNEGSGNLNETNGISVNDLDNYKGQLGISISARDIAIKGHKPTTATISVSENFNSISETITLDPDLNIGQFSLEVEDLSEDEKNELESGVGVTISVKDENGTELKNESFNDLAFEANPEDTEISASGLPDILDDLSFKPGIKYYIQILDDNGASNNASSLFVNYVAGGTFGVPLQQKDNYDYSETNSSKLLHQFQILPITGDPGSFVITAKVTPTVNTLFMNMENGYLYQDNSIHVEDVPDFNTLSDDHKFRVSRTENNNLYTIRPVSNNTPLRKRVINNSTRFNNFGDSNDPLLYVRILTVDVDWTITGLETRHLPPILPAPIPDFAFNTKYINCSQGLATDTKLVEHSEEKVYTVTFEESFSMTSRQSSTNTTTVGVSAEATFFGVGTSVSAEHSISNTTETEISNTTTQGASDSTSETITYSTERYIEVNPGTATNVYDAYQVYRNIKVPFIQRYKIEGNYINDPSVDNVSGPLTGQEILTQFVHSNVNNGGVITEVGQNHIEITVRGVSTIADVYETISRAEDADPNCN